MKRLYLLVRDFIEADFHFRTYALVLLWALILLTVNFTINLEDDFIDMLPTNGLRFLGYFSLYFVSYYTTVLIALSRLAKKERNDLLNRKFWLISLSGITIYSLDTGFLFHKHIIEYMEVPDKLYRFCYALLSNAIEFLTIALPLFLVNRYFIPTCDDNLGINKKEIELRPFFVLLLLIAPFIFFSAYEKGLNNYYPTFRYASTASTLHVATWVPLSLYEFFYGLDFFNVELMFRGFMVVGMSALLGRHALLPMAVFYCTIHFGKPLAEAVSSLFGGYILGAIAYKTRAIWGGVIVHIGLALLMEFSAMLVKNQL